MESLVLSGKPGNGVEVTDSAVKIQIKIRKINKVIPFANIISVKVKKPGLGAGFINFQTVGGIDNQRRASNEILKDENTWIITKKSEYEIALKIQQRIENYRLHPQMETSNADEILKFKNLLDAGAITQEEFDAKKKQLLGL